MQYYGFKDDSKHMRMLTDDQPERLKPTTQNILDSLDWLTSDLKAGDQLFFHYSGHGTQMPDRDNDETDGKCILPSKAILLLVSP